jgi:amino acid permease
MKIIMKAADDILVPEFNSPQRKSTVIVAAFNLTATIMGGGVLSIPYAYSKSGIILGSLLMVITAIITERSLYLLCLCSRLTGAATYGEVGEAAFGKNMEYFISFILGIFLMFAITGYMVLAKDIWTALVYIIGRFDVTTTLPPSDELVLGVTILLIVPFLVQKSLYALRFNCYISFSSVSILCLALIHQAWTTTSPTTMVWSNNINDALWWSTNFEDVLVAFPIISLSFVGIFNVLPIQNALFKPTRSRILLAVDGSILSCFVVAQLFGLAGYLYAGKQVDGNILNNCDPASDIFLLLGQFCCGITVVLAIPMMLLPCRSSLLEVLDVLIYGPHQTPVEVEESEHLPLIIADIKSIKTNNNYNSTTTTTTTNGQNQQQQQQQQNGHETRSSCPNNTRRFKTHIIDNTFIHYTSTLFIIVTCYMVAVHVPGVAVVWSILGCSMGFLISFILPSVCYLKIQRRYPDHTLKSKAWVWFSWISLITSSVALVACTTETIIQLM